MAFSHTPFTLHKPGTDGKLRLSVADKGAACLARNDYRFVTGQAKPA